MTGVQTCALPIYVYVRFSRRKIPCTSAYTITEKAIRFRHPDYSPDPAQKLISLSMPRHLSTRNISSKSMHAFLSNLGIWLTDRQTNERGQTHLPPPLSEVITIIRNTSWNHAAPARATTRTLHSADSAEQANKTCQIYSQPTYTVIHAIKHVFITTVFVR